MRAALATVVAASAVPYGYTISIWSSGAMLMAAHGVPRVGEVFAFLAGAIAGYGALALVAHGALTAAELADHAPPDRVLAGTLHWLAAGVAVGAAALLAGVGGWVAWPLTAFAATVIYLLGASAQLAVVTTTRARRRGRSGSCSS